MFERQRSRGRLHLAVLISSGLSRQTWQTGLVSVLVITSQTHLQTETVLGFIVETPVRVETPGPVPGVLYGGL